MNKVNVAIIGTGNIGTDLLFKVNRSSLLNCILFVGRSNNSTGIQLAQGMGVPVSTHSIDAIIQNPNCCEIVFDATSAKGHYHNAPILQKLGKYVIDLTPSRIGKMCVPAVNLVNLKEYRNVNMVTCGAQGTIPIIYGVKRVQDDIRYVEVVASIASKSAGMGTRNNIDEFTQTTKEAIIEIACVENAKAIITLNPAEPPKHMHNTVFMLIDNPDIKKIQASVAVMVKNVQQYVPGYNLILAPTLENGRVTMMVQVDGLGDFLPVYAGNLDIMTCAAIAVAEQYVLQKNP